MDLTAWIVMLIKVIVVAMIVLQAAPIMAWVERRGSALMQNRLGPNRIGPLGLFQSLADAVKFLWKEDGIPGHVNRFYYVLAPIVSLIPTFMTFAVIPMAGPLDIGDRVINFQAADLNVGLLYILSIASLGVYGIIMSGWSSNNKYALLGSMRSSAQMISYELSMGLSLVAMVMIYQSVHLGEIAAYQHDVWRWGPIAIAKWGIFMNPLGFLIFLTSVFAETNRLPFDLPEGESEIVAGYHLEYGSMKFALFQMAEYGNMTVGAALISTLYFGGYHFPFVHSLLHLTPLSGMAFEIARAALEFGAFLLKVAFFMWFFVWVRWTIPRFRYDQLMDLGWKFMLPLSLLNIVLTAGAIYLGWV